MSRREIDLRDPSVSKITPEREAELRAAAEQLGGELPGAGEIKITRFDPTTGNPAVIKFQRRPPAAGEPPPGPDNRVLRVLGHLQRLGPVLGLAPGQAAEFVPAPAVQETSGGAKVVQLQQFHKSIPIFEANQTVRLSRDDTISQISGRTVTVDEDVSTVPALTAEQAVRRAVEHAALGGGGPDLAGFEPKVITSFLLRPDRPTVLEPGAFQAPITASLIWFPDDRLRLAWDVRLAMPDGVSRLRVLVDAMDGTILYSRQLTRT
jgi:hypothetical protein